MPPHDEYEGASLLPQMKSSTGGKQPLLGKVTAIASYTPASTASTKVSAQKAKQRATARSLGSLSTRLNCSPLAVVCTLYVLCQVHVSSLWPAIFNCYLRVPLQLAAVVYKESSPSIMHSRYPEVTQDAEMLVCYGIVLDEPILFVHSVMLCHYTASQLKPTWCRPFFADFRCRTRVAFVSAVTSCTFSMLGLLS